QRLSQCRRKIFAGIDELVALKLVLLVIELFVPAFSREQLLVGAPFDDLTAFEDQDLVGAPDRGEPVRDDEGRASPPQRSQSVLNQSFALAGETVSCFIKDKQFGIGENCPRDGDALSLPA